jgi:hypothetical protein
LSSMKRWTNETWSERQQQAFKELAELSRNRDLVLGSKDISDRLSLSISRDALTLIFGSLSDSPLKEQIARLLCL